MLIKSLAKCSLCVYADMSRREDMTVTNVSTSSLEGVGGSSDSTSPVFVDACLRATTVVSVATDSSKHAVQKGAGCSRSAAFAHPASV